MVYLLRQFSSLKYGLALSTFYFSDWKELKFCKDALIVFSCCLAISLGFNFWNRGHAKMYEKGLESETSMSLTSWKINDLTSLITVAINPHSY